MELLDFGYSQSKWVAEQVVVDARVTATGTFRADFRPALVSPSVTGGGNNFDIAVRLVAFMVNHGIGMNTQPGQLSGGHCGEQHRCDLHDSRYREQDLPCDAR